MNLNFWRRDTEESDNNTDRSHDREKSRFNEIRFDEVEAVDYSRESQELEDSGSAPPDPNDLERARFYSRISRFALYIGIFLLPIFFLPWASNPLEFNKIVLLVIAAGVGLIAWLLGVVSSGRLSWRFNGLDKGMVAVIGGFVISTIFSVAPFKSTFGNGLAFSNSLISIVCFSIFYFLIVNNIEDRGNKIKLLVGLSSFAVLLYGLLQLFGVYAVKLPFALNRGFNSVGSLNSLGVVAAIILPFAAKTSLIPGWFGRLHIEKWLLVASLTVLAITNWWILWVIAITGMAAMIVFENFSGNRFRILKFILPMTIIVIGVFLSVVNFNFGTFKNSLPVEVAPSFNLSMDVVKSVLGEKLIYGYGLENFQFAFDRYGARQLAGSNLSSVKFFDSTAEFLTLVVDGGLAMILAIGFFLWCLIRVFFRLGYHLKSDEGRVIIKESAGVLASLTAIVAAFFLYPFNLTLFLMLFVFSGLAVLSLYGDTRKEFNIEQKIHLSLISSLGFIGGLILVLVGAYFIAIMYAGDVQYAKALNTSDNQQATGYLVKAINWNGNDDRYYRSASQNALALLAQEINKPQDADRDGRIQNYITTAISLARKATEINPAESLNWSNLGLVYQNLLSLIDGVDVLSESAYGKAAELRPGDPNFYYRIGLLYLSKFDLVRQLVAARRTDAKTAAPIAQDAISKAEANFKKAVETSPNFGLAIYNLGVVYDRQGEIAEAISQLEKIMPFNGNQPGLAFELGLLYYRAGRKTEALDQLQRAVVLAPDYANARWYLALIFEENGSLDLAMEQLEKILSVDINKGNEAVTAKLNDLRAGKKAIPPAKVLDQKPIQ